VLTLRTAPTIDDLSHSTNSFFPIHSFQLMYHSLPSADTPLYNHPLPDIETWLTEQGCQQDRQELHIWRVERPEWSAELSLDIEELTVIYGSQEGGPPIQRTFKYSLSRHDIEAAVFAGP
jgi:hypothetical protein